MAENGNRGPSDTFRRGGRRRREPPIIDAAATELPPDPIAEDQAADAVDPFAMTPPVEPTSQAPDEAAIPAESAKTENPEPEPLPVSETASGDGDGGGTATASPEEPVLFGHAARDPGRTTGPVDAVPESSDAAVTSRSAEPAAPEAPDVAVSSAPASKPPTEAGEPPRSGPDSAPSAPAPSGGPSLAGLLGIAAVLLLAVIGWLLYSGGQRNDDVAAGVADLKSRLAKLEARPDPAGLQAQVATLEKRVASAETDRAALGKQVADLTARLDSAGQPAPVSTTTPTPTPPALATADGLAALDKKVDGLDGRIATLSEAQDSTAKTVAALPKPVPPDFGPILAKVAALETLVNAVDAKMNGSDARLNGYDARINGVEAKVNEFGTTMNAMAARMNGLETKVDDGAAGIAKLRSDLLNLPKVDLGPLQAAAAALDARVAKVEGELAAPKDGARATDARAVGSADETRATPIAVIGQSIQRAIATGRPYAPEIDALKALGADPALVARLGPAATGGVPGVEALIERWSAVRGAVLDTEKPIAPAAGGTLNRFLASATSIVQVHPVGAVAGADTGALVSQIDAALAAGDVPGALAAWDKLPEAGKTASRAWAEAARSRIDAIGAASDLVRGAIATLAGARN